ncbi:restin homolog isoform X2 [Hibiscus syriacus]|uniref:restin homolog isoform X2 n=1 Tax=Hibiscus syriacus TaxID=106335 RepID=UPI001921BA1D|nr:restin homolog isoform X2 [Hibiscus syriacus]
MATEAEIIPEPISVLKTEEEISKPSLDLKKSEAGLALPAGTYESLDKSENIELATNNVVETLNTVSQANPEKPGNIEVEMSQNAEIESNKQEENLELKKQALIRNPDLIMDSSNEANEIVTKADPSNIIQVELEEKSIEEKKDTEPEKVPAAVEKGEGTEATDPAETSVSEKDQIIPDSNGDTLTSKVAETTEIRDHETISEVSEVSGKELQNDNPYKEAAQVGEKPEETSKEPEIEEHPEVDISSSSVSDETVKESVKEYESIPLKSTEKADSSTALEDSTRDTKEKTLVEGSINTAEPESAPVVPETEEKKKETDNAVPTEENNLAMTGHQVAGVDGLDIDVEPADSQTRLPHATDETLMEKEDNPTLDVPNIEAKETGPEHLPKESYLHREQENGKCKLVAETLKDEQSSDLGFLKEKIEDGKQLDEAMGLEDTSGICEDVEKVIQAEDDLAKNLAEQETEVPKGATEQISEVKNMNVNEEKSKETIPELRKSQADETIPDVQNQESEQNINEEPEDKLEDEQKANEVSKDVILSKEVEDYTSVSNECMKERDSKEQVQAKNLEVKEHSTMEREASLIVESAERKQVQESGNHESVPIEVGELEEKVKDIVHESKQHSQEKSDETVTKVGAETSLGNTEMNEELVNYSLVEMSKESIESDANQENKQVENPQQELEKTEQALEPKVNEAEQTKAVPETSSEYPSESIPTSAATLPSKDEEIETAHLNEKMGEEIHKDAEIVKHERTIEEVCLQKEGESEPMAISVEKTIVDEGLQNKEPEDQIQTSSTSPSKDDLSDAKQTAVICLEKEEDEDDKKDETCVGLAIEVEEPKDQASASALTEDIVDQAQDSLAEESREIETSALPSEKNETMESEPQKDESPPKIQEQTTEVEESSNTEVETSEKAFDNESIKEKLVKASSGENKSDNKNETIVNEVSKEELLEVKEVTETSNLISELEEPAKDGYGENAPKDKLTEDKALETTQTEEESSLELSQSGPDGAKGSDNQISSELEPIENTEITISIVKEHAPIDLQDKVAESSEKAEVEDAKEVYPKEAYVGHDVDKLTDSSGEKITEELTSVEDLTKIKELKDEHTADKTNETLKIPASENEKDGANNNVEKETVAEDHTFKDQKQAQVNVKEATTVPEESMEKPEAREMQPGEAKEISHGEEKTDTSVAEINVEHASASSGNLSLSDLLQRSAEEKIEVAESVIEERELTVRKEEAHVEVAETIPAKEPKIDGVPGGDELNKNDSGSDGPVIVEAPRDAETKPHKKSQNILSGVGSKVKNSISKVKKAITGKSSHSKEPKAISPKGNDK